MSSDRQRSQVMTAAARQRWRHSRAERREAEQWRWLEYHWGSLLYFGIALLTHTCGTTGCASGGGGSVKTAPISQMGFFSRAFLWVFAQNVIFVTATCKLSQSTVESFAYFFSYRRIFFCDFDHCDGIMHGFWAQCVIENGNQNSVKSEKSRGHHGKEADVTPFFSRTLTKNNFASFARGSDGKKGRAVVVVAKASWEENE